MYIIIILCDVCEFWLVWWDIRRHLSHIHTLPPYPTHIIGTRRRRCEIWFQNTNHLYPLHCIQTPMYLLKYDAVSMFIILHAFTLIYKHYPALLNYDPFRVGTIWIWNFSTALGCHFYYLPILLYGDYPKLFSHNVGKCLTRFVVARAQILSLVCQQTMTVRFQRYCIKQ